MNAKTLIIIAAVLVSICSYFYFGYIHNPVSEKMEEIIKLQTNIDVHNILPKDKVMEEKSTTENNTTENNTTENDTTENNTTKNSAED